MELKELLKMFVNKQKRNRKKTKEQSAFNSQNEILHR